MWFLRAGERDRTPDELWQQVEDYVSRVAKDDAGWGIWHLVDDPVATMHLGTFSRIVMLGLVEFRHKPDAPDKVLARVTAEGREFLNTRSNWRAFNERSAA